MSYTQAGSCPKCGAPIWLPTMWWATTPPPVTYSCKCYSQPQPQTSVNGTAAFWPQQQPKQADSTAAKPLTNKEN